MNTSSLMQGGAAKYNEPFLRWAGGKRKLVRYLIDYLPSDIAQRTYREPFLGAGALFFAMRPEYAFISDANSHLIKCYEYVRDNPDLIHKYLQQHAAQSTQEYYYATRNIYNKASFSAAQAARFIYLNKTCFNGIFRVNQRGDFNVPYGWKDPPPLPARQELSAVSTALSKAKIAILDFKDSLSNIKESDFFYLDPPYPPLNGTSFFTHYTKDRFSSADQVELSRLIHLLNDSGCKFMMSNAYTDFTRKLYSMYNQYEISVRRWVTSRSKKHYVSEMIVTNYTS